MGNSSFQSTNNHQYTDCINLDISNGIETCTCRLCGKPLWKKEKGKYSFISKLSDLYEKNGEENVLCGTLRCDIAFPESWVRIKFVHEIARELETPICKYCMLRVLNKIKKNIKKSLK